MTTRKVRVTLSFDVEVTPEKEISPASIEAEVQECMYQMLNGWDTIEHSGECDMEVVVLSDSASGSTQLIIETLEQYDEWYYSLDNELRQNAMKYLVLHNKEEELKTGDQLWKELDLDGRSEFLVGVRLFYNSGNILPTSEK